MFETITISQSIFPFLIIIFSIMLHELAHGYAAYVQGDYTAHRAGRLTLNPFAHIDMVGSVIVPFLAFLTAGTFFGWAKPVPYNPHNLRTRIGEAFVASAGILTNLLIAFMAGVVFKILLLQGVMTESLAKAIFTVLSVNVSLAFFNLIPIPPFDGMAIIQSLFPKVTFSQRMIFNPLYMVGAIITASVLYGIFAPHLFALVESILL